MTELKIFKAGETVSRQEEMLRNQLAQYTLGQFVAISKLGEAAAFTDYENHIIAALGPIPESKDFRPVAVAAIHSAWLEDNEVAALFDIRGYMLPYWASEQPSAPKLFGEVINAARSKGGICTDAKGVGLRVLGDQPKELRAAEKNFRMLARGVNHNPNAVEVHYDTDIEQLLGRTALTAAVRFPGRFDWLKDLIPQPSRGASISIPTHPGRIPKVHTPSDCLVPA